MSHELRTPLKCGDRFSEVMQHELHGPLGNARYQEYAHHISESGGRLLKSSEEALAITEIMTALMADRRRGKRERLVAGTLVREAWRPATRMGANAATLKVIRGNACVIVSERRPVTQALEHLLREASSRVPTGGAVQVVGRRRAGKCTLEISAGGEPDATQTTVRPTRPDGARGSDLAGGSLDLILARLLLETQSATLTCTPPRTAPGRAARFPAKECPDHQRRSLTLARFLALLLRLVEEVVDASRRCSPSWKPAPLLRRQLSAIANTALPASRARFSASNCLAGGDKLLRRTARRERLVVSLARVADIAAIGPDVL